jgi:hypothetical protein
MPVKKQAETPKSLPRGKALLLTIRQHDSLTKEANDVLVATLARGIKPKPKS